MASNASGGAARAGAWNAIDIVVRQGVQFVVSVILARLLSPEDFGVMALLAFFTGFGIVVESGLASVLIQRHETTREQESALFWIGLAFSIAFACLLVVLGPAIAQFFEQDVLAPLMWLAGAQVIVMTLGIVPSALLSREMRFAAMAKVALVAALLSSTASVAAAVSGAGVWALGIQFLSFTAINTAGTWLVTRWRPLARVRGTNGRVLLNFSTKVGFSQLVDHLSGQGFTLLIGKLHGVAALGLYNRAQATQYFASGTLGAIFKRLVLPLFSSRVGDPVLLRETVKKALQLAMLVNLPVMVGLSLTSDLVILTLFGAAWAPAAPILSVLALAGILWPMHVINSQLLLAIDRPDLYWRTEVAKKSVGIVCILVGSAFGIMGLAWSQVIFSLFAHFFNGHFSAKHIGYGSFRQIRDVSGVALICGIMAAAVLAVRPLLDQPPLLLLCTIGLLGIITYSVTGFVARIEEFKEARRVLVGAIAQRR